MNISWFNPDNERTSFRFDDCSVLLKKIKVITLHSCPVMLLVQYLRVVLIFFRFLRIECSISTLRKKIWNAITATGYRESLKWKEFIWIRYGAVCTASIKKFNRGQYPDLSLLCFIQFILTWPLVGTKLHNTHVNFVLD